MTLTYGDLTQFTGTEKYYYLPFFPTFRYTDGVQYLAEKAGAYWLLTSIFALQMDPSIAQYRQTDDFQVWILEKEHFADEMINSAFLICEDGNKNELYRQHIPFTDFPLERMDLWLEGNVLILPREH